MENKFPVHTKPLYLFPWFAQIDAYLPGSIIAENHSCSFNETRLPANDTMVSRFVSPPELAGHKS